MKIILVAPDHETRARGNVVTVERWRRGIAATSHDVDVSTPGELESHDAVGVDVIHAHHAVHCGPAAVRAADRLGARLVVSLGGTDLNAGLDEAATKVLRRADVVIGSFATDADRLRDALGTAPRFATVRRGVAVSSPDSLPPVVDRVEILMVGGIRAIKGQREAVAWVRELGDQGVASRLTLAGPIVEQAYGAALSEDLLGTPHRHLGELDHDAVARELGRCHLLLNASFHEGASNAILEAWAAGRPVAARFAPGNREMLEPAPEEIAVLFSAAEPRPFFDRVESLRDATEAERARIASAARAWALEAHSVADEISELIAAYRLACD